MAEFCAFCKRPLGWLYGCSSFDCFERILDYGDIYPASPHKQFSIENSKTCQECAKNIAILFGCSNSINIFDFPPLSRDHALSVAKISAPKAKRYFEKHAKTLPAGKEKDFLEYALSIPQKIIDFESDLPSKIQFLQQELLTALDKFNSNKAPNIKKIKSQNHFIENEFYTLGIVDDTLLVATYSAEGLRSEVDEFRFVITNRLPAFINKTKALHKRESEILQHFEKLEKEWTMISVPLDKIKHFKMVGSIGYSSDVHGGGGSGGGVNMGGAVAGALLFGGVGAIIGSQLGTETRIDAVKTEVTEHDNRKVEFFYEDESGTTVSLILGPTAYECLMKLIPEKAFDAVVTNAPQSEEVAQPTAPASASLSQLKELKELLDMGIITQEEFDAKKKQILGL